MKFIDQELYDDIKSGTNIVSGEEYSQIVYAISNLAAEMVIKTLGPYGSTTIIDDSTFTYPSKDGWACLRNLRFNDPIYNTIYNTIKQISFSIVEKVGDGTTSALIGANAFLKEIFDYKENNEFRQVDFLNTLEKVRDKVISNLKASPELKRIDRDGNFDDIRKVAYISSNSNDKLSDIIQKIYQETKNPHIHVSLDHGYELGYEIQEGYKFDAHALNLKAYANNDDGTCKKVDKKIMVAIFDHNVTYNEHGEIVTTLSKFANQINSEIIILAPHFDDIITNIIGTTINSFLQRQLIPNIMMVQVPLSMDIHRKYLSDIVMLTNSQVFDYGKVRAFNVMMHNINAQNEDEKIEDSLLNIDQYKFESPTDLIETCIGEIRSITVGNGYAILQDYNKVVNPDLFKATMKEVEDEYLKLKEKTNKQTTSLTKDFMNAQLRYIKLTGKMGVIKVGGVSELEKHCLKDSVDDAVLACKSAFENGYIRGLYLTTMKIIRDMLIDGDTPKLEREILAMLFNVFYEISLSVLRNKYSDDVKRVVKCQTFTKYYFTNSEILDTAIFNDYGYNLVTEELEPIDELTVINSVSTDIEILNAMISILSLMLTSSQFISINRMYDRKVGRRQVLDQKIKDQEELASAITRGILNVLNKEGIEMNKFLNSLINE